MFKGRYNHIVDEKGRTSLPARFREVVTASGNEKVVLTYALDSQYPHVDVYTFSRWAEFEDRLSQKSMFDESVIMLKRLYVANAVECSLDSHGRILIPSAHRDYARLESEATWVGMTRTIELWKTSLWEEAQNQALRDIGNVRTGLADLEL